MISKDECIKHIQEEFDVLGVVNCDDLLESIIDLQQVVQRLHRDSYDNDQRIVFVITQDSHPTDGPGTMLQNIQAVLNVVDISNFFATIVTTNPNIHEDYQWVLENVSADPVPVNIYQCSGEYQRRAQNIEKFSKIKNVLGQLDLVDKLSAQQKQLLFENKTFCILPWTAFNIEGKNIVRPCCESQLIVGDPSKSSLEELWNSPGMKSLRRDMLAGQEISSCQACYKKESLGIDSLRTSMNRKLISRIYKVDSTQSDGTLADFSLNHWDTRYNNLCNLACRSCGPGESSSWHEPAVAIGRIPADAPVFLFSGRSETDIFEQMIPHIDHIDNVYFSGGEPLMMENNYDLLEMLDQRGRHDVSLVYNTNLTRTALKGRSIIDLWKKFPKVAVGASLDAEGPRAEYLRVGTVWATILENRRRMIEECPHIDFYVSATTGLINALHIPDFHRSWVEQGLIRAEDFNIQLLLMPSHLRVSTAPLALKEAIRKKYQAHLEWLIPRDRLGRAVAGFRGILNSIEDKNPFESNVFWKEVQGLDRYHGTNLYESFPELVGLLEE